MVGIAEFLNETGMLDKCRIMYNVVMEVLASQVEQKLIGKGRFSLCNWILTGSRLKM